MTGGPHRSAFHPGADETAIRAQPSMLGIPGSIRIRSRMKPTFHRLVAGALALAIASPVAAADLGY
ncbi:hypothetical protein, partial [Methylobacterium sp. WL103]|uniref:hypothetical protein n=1 Tax=Methylobacterium sp. WL103 TaxID=2603891 RepID=UPI001AEEE9F0